MGHKLGTSKGLQFGQSIQSLIGISGTGKGQIWDEYVYQLGEGLYLGEGTLQFKTQSLRFQRSKYPGLS